VNIFKRQAEYIEHMPSCYDVDLAHSHSIEPDFRRDQQIPAIETSFTGFEGQRTTTKKRRGLKK
jgi:hypothetical protein